MTAPTLASLKVKLFTDGADKAQIVEMARQSWIAGFTTNPSLLKKAGVSDRTLELIPLVRQVVDVPLGVVTFDTSRGVAAVEAGADIVLIGHPYVTGPNAEEMLTDYVRQVRSAVRG